MVFAENQQQIDAFVKSVKGVNGMPLFNSGEELYNFISGKAGLSGANEFFSALDNKLVTQFVYDMTMYPTFLRQNHFRGEFAYGDTFEHIWQLQNFGNVKPYNKTSYTPKDLETDGIKLTRTQLVYRNKQNVQITNAIALDEKLVRGAFQPNAIGAFNKLIAVYLGTLLIEIDEFYYNLEPKVIKVGVKNTIKLKGNTTWPKPSYVTNDTQYQLSFIKHLLAEMTIPSRGKYSMVGKIGDVNPFATTAGTKFVKTDFPVRKLNSVDDAFFYVSPSLKARFESFCYATTYNEGYLKIANRMIVVPLDRAQEANGAEVLDSDPFGKMMKPAQAKVDSETIYLVTKNAFAITDRFKVSISSNWVNGQLVRTVSQFTDYTWLPWNIAVKIELKL